MTFRKQLVLFTSAVFVSRESRWLSKWIIPVLQCWQLRLELKERRPAGVQLNSRLDRWDARWPSLGSCLTHSWPFHRSDGLVWGSATPIWGLHPICWSGLWIACVWPHLPTRLLRNFPLKGSCSFTLGAARSEPLVFFLATSCFRTQPSASEIKSVL